MLKTSILFLLLLPLAGFAQYTITGKVYSGGDGKPVGFASIFLSNASVGGKTAEDGTFTLTNAKQGKYELVITVVGFQKHTQQIIVNGNITLPDIEIEPKSIALKEVSIKPKKADPNRERNYEWFKQEFFGYTDIAKDCRILNPGVIELDYDENTSVLTASSYDFLEIVNDDLGYKIKYLLNSFSLDRKDEFKKVIHWDGSALFETMNGIPSQEKQWQKNRQAVYENSMMHFLRAALWNRIDNEGFRVVKLATYPNPQRPDENLIKAKISQYNKPENIQRDSLAYWTKKSKLPKTIRKLSGPLTKSDLIKSTGQRGISALEYDNDVLFVTYNKSHHFHMITQADYLDNPKNSETTLLTFNSPSDMLFDNNGVALNPNAISFRGVWGRERMAGLLPVDYEPSQIIGKAGVPQETPVEKLEAYAEKHITEKVYLHFDKPYYAAGDTIYFKAYVTAGERHRLSGMSGVLHVDLINANDKISKSIKLQLAGGISWGDFALPDSLPRGNYRVRAYTQWMRNEENYFEQILPIGSLRTGNIPESSQAKLPTVKPDLQFFPEGGELIDGIRSKVAFKAVGLDGLGVDIKGMIIDNAGNEVGKFSSTHLGMGYFYLDPEAGKTYRAKVTYTNGEQSIVELARPVEKGITLSVNNDSIPKAVAKVEVNKAFFAENKGKDFTLLVYSGGSATTVDFRLDSMTISLDILKRRLHTGITRLTLFSASNEPLSERLLFVQNYDQLNLSLNSDKPGYVKRGAVSIRLNARNRADSAVTGHFSVSVIDENKVPVDENKENTILSNLLLTSDLKGTVEEPNYYFTNVTDETLHNLDLVMLTHGYRHFDWKPLLDNTYPPLAWQSEKGLEISGVAKSLLNKPLANASVSLISPVSKQFTCDTTDAKGNFHFINLGFTDSTSFILQAANAKGSNNTKLSYNEDPAAPNVQPLITRQEYNQLMAAYMDNDKKLKDDLVKYGAPHGRMLKEVRIRDIKENNNYASSNLGGPGHADQVWHHSDIHGGGNLLDQLNGILRGIQWVGSLIKIPYYNGHPMLIVLDGFAGADFSAINLPDVETVEVLKNAAASIYGMSGGGGVLVITTRKGSNLDPKDIPSIGILPIKARGFYKARAFYSPKYESNITTKRPDLRSTIYWNPELLTDKDGNTSFDYFNADSGGTYLVVVEGIDENGNIGRQVYRYKVE